MLAIQESTKLLPWVLSARKHMRAYLKVLLELWSGAPNDGVRIAAFLAVRRVFEGGDEAMRDQCLKVSLRILFGKWAILSVFVRSDDGGGQGGLAQCVGCFGETVGIREQRSRRTVQAACKAEIVSSVERQSRRTAGG